MATSPDRGAQVLLLALDFLCCNAVLELAKDCVAVLARLVLQDDASLDRVLDANGIPLLVQHTHILAQGTHSAHTRSHLLLSTQPSLPLCAQSGGCSVLQVMTLCCR